MRRRGLLKSAMRKLLANAVSALLKHKQTNSARQPALRVTLVNLRKLYLDVYGGGASEKNSRVLFAGERHAASR